VNQLTARKNIGQTVGQWSEMSVFQLTTEYGSAVEEFAIAAAELRHQADLLKSFAYAAVRSPGQLCFDRIDGEPEPQLSVIIKRPGWSESEFPTPRSLQSALRQRELAKRKLQDIWKNLPAAARSKLAPPPRK
jgi:hypothetical protein